MDFYSNETMARAETQRRIAELRQHARRSVAPTPEPAGDQDSGWTHEFMAWVATRARAGAHFMARTPTNP